MHLDDDDVRSALLPPTGEWKTRAGLRDAAVLLPLNRRSGTDHVLFTLRRANLPDHPGQVALPGGARDPNEDVVSCALRETEEEVGLPTAHLTPLGRLVERVSIAGFLVSPVVARVEGEHELALDPREVADAFWVPITTLLERDHWSFRVLDAPRAGFRHIPYFDGGRHTVWGLTGVIVCDFLRAVLDFDPGP